VDALTTPRIKVSVSELNTFLRCRRKYLYQYIQGLRPRRQAVPIARGVLLHNCLETHYRGKDWTQPLRDAEAYMKANLFEEEQAEYAQIIADSYAIMRNYLNFLTRERADADFEIVDVEKAFEVELPNGHIYEGRFDLVVRDEMGLGIIDHKTVGTIPSEGMRLTDWQTTLYPFAAEKVYGEPINWICFNYLSTKAPKTPELTQKGTMSKAAITTDWYTYEAALRKAGLNPADYADMRLKLEGKVFFRREFLPRPARMVREVVKEATLTAGMIEPYLNHKEPEKLFYPRTITRDCDWCAYKPLCQAEMFGSNTEFIRAEQYTKREVEEPVAEEEDDD
jgi:hypothetical protein